MERRRTEQGRAGYEHQSLADPTSRNRRRPIGVGVLLALLVVLPLLLVVRALGLGLWNGGEMGWPLR
jgi:hypothetical protein